jgi:hypothetical protein
MSTVPTFSGAPPPKYQKSKLPKASSSSSSFSTADDDDHVRPNRRSSSGGGKGGGFRDAWISVQALGATQLHGWKRRAWEADAFEALGGKKQVREHAMPNKMRMGIMKKREVREAKREEEVRKADLVTGGDGGGSKKKRGGGQRDRDRKRKMSSRDSESDPMANRREAFHNGVLRVQRAFKSKGGDGGRGGGRRGRGDVNREGAQHPDAKRISRGSGGGGGGGKRRRS